MAVKKTICDLCGKEVPGGIRPGNWISIWAFFGETNEFKQKTFMLDVCSRECLLKSWPAIQKWVEAAMIKKEGGEK